METHRTGTALAALLLTAVSGCAGGVQNEQDTVTLTFADLTSQDNTLGQAAQAMFEAIDEEYAGTIEVEYFWSGSMAGGTEILNSLSSDMVDSASIPTAYYPKDLPVASWAEGLTGLAPTANILPPFVANPAMHAAFDSEAVTTEYAEHNAVPVTVATTDSYALVCKDPIDSLEEARGKLVRVASTQHGAEVEELGMSPVSLAHGETYEALQRGTIDCTITSISGAEDLGLYEIAKHLIPIGFSPTVLPVLFNTDTLESLPEDLQEIIRTTGRQAYFDTYAHASFDEVHELLEDGPLARDADTEILIPTDMRDALAEFRTQRAKDLAEAAPEGLDDAEALVTGFAETAGADAPLFEEASGISADLPEDAEEFRARYATMAERTGELDGYLEEVAP